MKITLTSHVLDAPAVLSYDGRSFRGETKEAQIVARGLNADHEGCMRHEPLRDGAMRALESHLNAGWEAAFEKEPDDIRHDIGEDLIRPWDAPPL